MNKLLVALISFAALSFAQDAISGPGTVSLLTPANNESLTDSRPQFSWSQTTPASTWYHLWIQRNTSKWLELWFQGDTSWTPPTNFPGGAYTWWVQGWNSLGYGPWSQGFRFNVPAQAPGVLSPISPHQTEVSNATVRYTWTADTNAGWYRLCVVKSNSVIWDQWYCATSSVVDTATGNFAVDVNWHYSGVYHWWVQAWNFDGLGPWSTMGSFTVPKLIPGAVTLVSPSGYQPNTSEVHYSWTPDPNAELYQLCLMKNGKVIFNDWCFDFDDHPGTNYTVGQTGHAGGTYQWWVRAWNHDSYGPWSSSLTYQVPVQVPAAPTLMWPYGTVLKRSLTFQWYPVEGAVRYYLTCKGTTKDGTAWTTASTPDTTHSAANSLLSAGTYYWYVNAWNEDGWSPASAVWSFTIAY